MSLIGFNPRAHAGRDQYGQRCWDVLEFQSTRPRGARLDTPTMARLLKVSIHAPTRGATQQQETADILACFNPRAHAGRDWALQLDLMYFRVSIHAPTRGATNSRLSILSI